MKYRMRMNAVKKEGSHLKAYGTMQMGDNICVKNLSLMENVKGELFLATPNRKTSKADRNGNSIYEDVCFPVTGEMRKQMQEAAIASYREGKTAEFSDDSPGNVMVSVTVFDAPFYNRVGKADLTINDCFVVSDVYINEKKQDGSLYVTFPNYKTAQKTQDGKDLYSEIVVLTGGMKKLICEEVLSEYRLSVKERENNRLTIKGRLKEAQSKSKKQEKKAEREQEVVK